jgi:hypothetical protein
MEINHRSDYELIALPTLNHSRSESQATISCEICTYACYPNFPQAAADSGSRAFAPSPPARDAKVDMNRLFYGRGGGVGGTLGVGAVLGVGDGLGVEVGVGVAVLARYTGPKAP